MENMPGITVGRLNIKHLCYADDMSWQLQVGGGNR